MTTPNLLWMSLVLGCQDPGDPDDGHGDDGSTDDGAGDDGAGDDGVGDDGGGDDGGGDDGGDDGGGDDTGPTKKGPVELVGEIGFVHDPDMVNIVTASFSLSAAAPATVVCEADLAGDWPERIVVADPAEATSHDVVVDGLLAETTYACTVEADGGTLGSFTVLTDPLPSFLTVATMTPSYDDPTAFSPGWTLLNPTDWGSGPPACANVIVDALGRIRWYVDLGEADGISAFEYVPEENLFYGGGGFLNPLPLIEWDETGEELLSWPNVGADHDVEKFGDDYYVVTGISSSDTSHCLGQRDSAKNLVWEWCVADEPLLPKSLANAIEVREESGRVFLYVNMQSSGVIYKLDRDSKELVWRYSEGGDFNQDIPYDDWMHDIQVLDCDGYTECMLLYVNGDPDSSARMVGIDEGTMTATVLREWTEPGWAEPRMGGIQLVGENWLIDQAHLDPQSHDTDRPTNIVEVAPDDTVVWRLVVEPKEISVYRARRVDACDLFHHAGYCPSLDD